MFKPNTVFVIGAAASFNGFPLGSDLKAKVAEALSVNWKGHPQALSGCLTTTENQGLYAGLALVHPENLREYYGAGKLVTNGIPFSSSIDNFLNLHKKMNPC